MDVATLDAAGAARLLRAIGELEGFLASMKVRATRVLHQLHETGAGPRPGVVLGGIVGTTEAGRVQRRSDALERTPAMEVALRAGAVTPSHVDALAGALRQTPALVDLQVQIASAATEMSPDRFAEHVRRLAMLHADDGGVGVFERQRRDTRVRSWVDRFTGMYQFHGQFDPERGAQLATVIRADVERQHHRGDGEGLDDDQRAAIALHRLCTRRTDDAEGGGAGVTMNVHIDERTLLHDLHEHSHVDLDGGGQLPVDTLRRLACDAHIRPIVLDGDRVVVDIGRTRRLATATQRAALRAMHPTCAIPGCGVAFAHCQIHHIRWWRHGGRTDLDNMVPLCNQHHHDTHEGGWQLAIGPKRSITWTRPPPSHEQVA